MTQDLLKRLREAGNDYTVAWGSGDLYDEAADEIERLTAVLARIRGAIAADRCDGESDWAGGVNAACKNHLEFIDTVLADVGAAPAVPAQPPGVRVECRECSECGHTGINDSHPDDARCDACGWAGPEPTEDRCPACQSDGTMTAACPKCCGRYTLITEATVGVAGTHETNTPESRDSQHVLKAEAARPDATDRENPGMASPDGGPMGVGQPAAAGPIGVSVPPLSAVDEQKDQK